MLSPRLTPRASRARARKPSSNDDALLWSGGLRPSCPVVGEPGRTCSFIRPLRLLGSPKRKLRFAPRQRRRARLPGSPKRELREYATIHSRPSAFPRLTPRASRARARKPSSSDDALLWSGGLRPSCPVAGKPGRTCSFIRPLRLPGSPKRKLRESATIHSRPSAFPRLTPRASRARARKLSSNDDALPSAHASGFKGTGKETIEQRRCSPLERRSPTVVPGCREARSVS